jgi:hypothetical protein
MEEVSHLMIVVAVLAGCALAAGGAAALICLCDWLTRTKNQRPREDHGRRVGTLMLVLLPAVAPAAETNPGAGRIDFNRDIRPILSDHCYTCHGPDATKRKARLRLDVREGVVGVLRSGGVAVVPGKRSESELWNRITTEDKADRMPPPRTGKELTCAQVELLGKWIDQGARWDAHWAYVPPKRPRLPAVADCGWPRNAIDFFVLARLEREGLRPSVEADRATLLRRATFDLTGLPPTPAEIDAFVNDPGPQAYEKVVDRLLASSHYGERMAQHWLDLARYADTNGYRLDNHRDMWVWRDWVIRAFNKNQPFDQFTVEQLAGDLLPRPTLEQRIATGFHRNTMVNFGNGSDPKEYLHKAVTDRAATTASVWLGTTLACAQCHDHKYDPFTQKDYYRLYAFFNNVPEKGLDGERANPVPTLLVPSPAQARQLGEIRKERARVERQIREGRASLSGLWGRLPACLGVGRLEAYPTDLLQRQAERLKKAEEALVRQIPCTMVMEEIAQPRVTHVLLRGDYLNEGEVVTPGVPASLPALPQRAPANRLGLARWLTDLRHPLTSRVAVNRAWQTFFGTGIVKTADDFGAQGEPPSHPELLDWLAVEFVARGWDVKALHRLIVTSATYRQASHLSRELHEKDPENRLLARGPRFRLEAETIRDNALAVSGLLDRRVGGPSVRPYQPPGLWEQVAVGGDYSSQTYVPSKGKDLYRRGMYTYWKRSMPHPALVTFDAPNRESCIVTRPRTNTPLQALVLLNDPTFMEASRALAQRVLREQKGTNRDGRLRYAFRLCTGRLPEPAEQNVLRRVLDLQSNNYRRDRQAARDLVRVGESPRPAGLDAAELAAWTAVANLLLNLDETITRG